MSSRWLTLEVPESDLMMSVAREGALNDGDLDGLESGLAAPDVDPLAGAGGALALGRAGRPGSASALEAWARRLEDRGETELRGAAGLAIELLRAPPPPWIERAEAGYRRTDPVDGSELYVEDPLAAYWHRRDRWGPPIRPRVELPDVEASGADGIEDWIAAALDGRLVRVDFLPGPVGAVLGARAPGWLRDLERARLRATESGRARLRRASPLWLCRAGFARDRALAGMVRWRQVRSLGFVEGRLGPRRVGFAGASGRVTYLPAGSGVPADGLHRLMAALADRARRA